MVQRQKGSSSTWNVTSRTIPVLEGLKLARIGDRSLLAKAERIAQRLVLNLGKLQP
jgi:hypothetical protein